ncbi:AI-2E family transporter [Pantanalinema rosaneae CENA516]|uniref:AI-2E family transporter n=1 Tax=Pantanalinema rosaneae TaxID=1620701 RepID=UPI003D6F27C1
MNRSPDLQRLLIIGLSGPIIALNLWLLSQIYRYFENLITVLIASALLALLLNYPVRLFERTGVPRTRAVIVVLFLTLTLLLFLGITLLPSVVDQTGQVLQRIPAWLEASRQNLEALDNFAKQRNLPLDLRGFSGRINNQIEQQLPTLPSQALVLALGTLGGLLNVILILVLAFYMLVYGDRLWTGLINLFPPRYGVPLSQSLWLNFHNFFISQLLLALFVTAVLIPIFLALRVPYALLFAIVIGVSELIPFIGAALGITLVTILVMFQNVGLAFWVAVLATGVHQVRDNVLAPKMMGSFTGLNPIWIFVALLTGLQVAGFLGIVIAVPIAGTIKTTLDIVRGINQLDEERWEDEELSG